MQPSNHTPLFKLCKISSGYVPNCSSALFVKVFIWLVQLLSAALGYVQQASVCGVLMTVKPYMTCTSCVQ